MDDLVPPPVPGAQSKKKKGFFSRLFKKESVDDIRVTQDSFDLEDIRKRAGLQPAPGSKNQEEQLFGENDFFSSEKTSKKDSEQESQKSPQSNKYEFSFPSPQNFSENEGEENTFSVKEPMIDSKKKDSYDQELEAELKELEHAHQEASRKASFEKEATSESDSKLAAQTEQKIQESTQPTNITSSKYTEEPKKPENNKQLKELPKLDISDFTKDPLANKKDKEEKNASSSWAESSSTEKISSASTSSRKESKNATKNKWLLDLHKENKAENTNTSQETASPWATTSTSSSDTSTKTSQKTQTYHAPGMSWTQSAEPNGTLKSPPRVKKEESEIILDGKKDSWTLPSIDKDDKLEKELASLEAAHELATQKNSPHNKVDKHFATLRKKHKTIDKKLEKAIKDIKTEIPEWKMQSKEVHPNNYFKLKNGQEVKNFKDLLEALSFVDQETFEHHVTEDRNDFAEWVKHILEEEKLAEKIRNKTAREELLKVLRDHEKKIVKELEKEIAAIEKDNEQKKKLVEQMTSLEKELDKLHKQVKEKSEQIKALKTKHSRAIKKQIDKHVMHAIDKEREELRKEEKRIEELEAKLKHDRGQLEDDQKQIMKQNKYLDEKKEKLLVEEERIANQRKAAQEIIDESEEVKRAVSENKKILDSIIKQKKELEKIAKKAAKDEQSAEKKINKLESKEKDLDTKRKELLQLEKELKKQERALKGSQEAVLQLKEEKKELVSQIKEERKNLREFKKRELSVLDEKQKEVQSMLDQLEKQQLTHESLLEKIEAERAQKEKVLQQNKEVLEETQEMHKELKKRESALESRSMREYLHSKIASTIPGTITGNPMPSVEDVSNIHLYKLVDQCREALSKSELDEAKSVYNKLREEFASTKLSSHEKSVLYNSIRELYDDIHLAMLNQ